MYMEALLAVMAVIQGQSSEVEMPAKAEAPQDIVVTGEKNERDRKVCKNETPTGSIMQKRTCRTVAEWEEAAQKSLVFKEKMDQERRARDMVQLLRGNPD